MRVLQPESFGYDDDGGSVASVISYEMVGPSSVASASSTGSCLVERTDENGNVMKDEAGKVIKWRAKRKGRNRRRRSLQVREGERERCKRGGD